MVEKIDSKAASFLIIGLSVGSLIGILFAPKSGKESREYLGQMATKGSEYTQKKAQELGARAKELAERGNQVVARIAGLKQGQIATATETVREAYQQQKAKAQAA